MSFPLFFAILFSLPAITFAVLVAVARLLLFLMVHQALRDPEAAKRALEMLESNEPRASVLAEPHRRAIRRLRAREREAR